MTYQPAHPTLNPAPPPLWWKRKPVIIGGAVLAVLVLAIIGSALPQDAPEPAAQPTTPPPSTAPSADPVFDRAVFDAWWASDAVPASVRGAVESVSWNGVALAAETSIVNDGDAKTTATAVCSALSAFWLTHGGFRPVQVIGTDGGVLVSRALESDQCTWRR